MWRAMTRGCIGALLACLGRGCVALIGRVFPGGIPILVGGFRMGLGGCGMSTHRRATTVDVARGHHGAANRAVRSIMAYVGTGQSLGSGPGALLSIARCGIGPLR